VLDDVGLLHPRRADPPTKPESILPFDWRVMTQVRPEIDNVDPGRAGIVAAITARTLVVAGGPRHPFSQVRINALIHLLPASQTVIIDAAHLVHATEPDVFIHELISRLVA
jgi:pimeloyl-ACP methyl ester carboxylesterase